MVILTLSSNVCKVFETDNLAWFFGARMLKIERPAIPKVKG
jgi:hypothetical protein